MKKKHEKSLAMANLKFREKNYREAFVLYQDLIQSVDGDFVPFLKFNLDKCIEKLNSQAGFPRLFYRSI